MLVLITMGITSCSLFLPKNHYYEYSIAHFDTGIGKFYVGLSEDVQNMTIDGNLIEVWGIPYYFNVQYSPRNGTILDGEIFNIQIRSLETGETVFTKDRLTDPPEDEKIQAAGKQQWFLAFGAEFPPSPYHDYEVSFDYRIFSSKDVIFEEGSVEAVLKLDFYKGHRRKGIVDVY